MATSDQAAVIDFLSSSHAFSPEGGHVQRIDTHISCVFLAGEFVYKLKKQLQFDFLDYSTLERRRWACEQEVELNRRLAPQVYLGVIPVTRDAQANFKLGGDGEVVEWLVQMRHLPESATLLHHIDQGTIAAEQIDSLGALLREFYHGQLDSRSPSETAQDYLAHLRGHIEGNVSELSKSVGDEERRIVEHIHNLQLRLLNLRPQPFLERARAGYVIDGHGDLRPEHIYFLPQPVIIDCIEFNAEFRRIDILDEISFLAVECERLGAEWIGKRLLPEVMTNGSGTPDPLLIDFYSSYRACVRAKVHRLRAAQLPERERAQSQELAKSYLELADHHAQRLERPLLLIVYGLSGTGKSTFAAALSGEFRLQVLSTDSLRKRLMAHADHAERYSEEGRRQVYQELFQQAAKRLAEGESLIVDGTFAQTEFRQQATDLAFHHDAMALFVRCHCEQEVALQRIAKRSTDQSSLSEATAEVYHRQVAHFERERETDPPIALIDTQRDLRDNLMLVKEILFPCGTTNTADF